MKILRNLNMGVSKNSGTPKWMVYDGKPYLKWDDSGGTIILETPICNPQISFNEADLLGLFCVGKSTKSSP